MENNELLEQEHERGMFVTPLGEFSYQSFPIIKDKKYFITDEESEKLGKHELKWHYEEETIQVAVDDLDNPIYDEAKMSIGYEKKLVDKVITKCSLVPNDNTHEILISNATKELAEIRQWFNENDWKPNKIITGEWLETDERWLEYKQEREVKRARQDELNALLENN